MGTYLNPSSQHSITSAAPRTNWNAPFVYVESKTLPSDFNFPVYWTVATCPCSHLFWEGPYSVTFTLNAFPSKNPPPACFYLRLIAFDEEIRANRAKVLINFIFN